MGCQLDCLHLRWKTCNARLMVDSWKRLRKEGSLSGVQNFCNHPLFPSERTTRSERNWFLCLEKVEKKFKPLNSPKNLLSVIGKLSHLESMLSMKKTRETGWQGVNKIHVPSSFHFRPFNTGPKSDYSTQRCLSWQNTLLTIVNERRVLNGWMGCI